MEEVHSAQENAELAQIQISFEGENNRNSTSYFVPTVGNMRFHDKPRSVEDFSDIESFLEGVREAKENCENNFDRTYDIRRLPSPPQSKHSLARPESHQSQPSRSSSSSDP